MTGSMAGRVVVVTGAASGIGRACAVAFAAQGAAVVVADVREEPREGGPPTVEAIRSAGGRASYATCDVTDSRLVEATLDEADRLGGCDVLVNNAGLLARQDFLTVSLEEVEQLLTVNVTGAFRVAQSAAQRMAERGRGTIINMSSVAAIRGAAGFVAYCTSKGAVHSMTVAMAAELGPLGIRVCAVQPGVVATSMLSHDVPMLGDMDAEQRALSDVPLGRAGTPQEIADAVMLLAGDGAGYVNGASLVVDGGLSRFS